MEFEYIERKLIESLLYNPNINVKPPPNWRSKYSKPILIDLFSDQIGIKFAKRFANNQMPITKIKYSNISIKEYCNYVCNYCKFKNIKIQNFKPCDDFNNYVLEILNSKTLAKFSKFDVETCYNELYNKFRNEINFAIPKIATDELQFKLE